MLRRSEPVLRSASPGTAGARRPSTHPSRTFVKNGRPPRVAMFVKRSTWSVYVEERKDPRVCELLAEGDVTVARLKPSHEEHERTVREVQHALKELGAELEVIGQDHEGFDSSRFDLVVTVGGDGTLLQASHSVGDTPVLGINSSPSHSVGFFCGAKSGHALEAIRGALDGTLRAVVLTRMRVTKNGEIVAPCVLNDALFCHTSPAATTRYILELTQARGNGPRRLCEEQKSSGFWIGPAAGSTAAQRSAGGRVLPLGSDKLQLVVREPYTPLGEEYRLRHVLVSPGDRLLVRSKTNEAKIFIDGPDRSIDVTRGDVLEFTQSDRSLTLLGISTRRRWGRPQAS